MITHSLQCTKFPAIAAMARTMEKSICVIDAETTGLLRNPPVGIVEFAYLRVNPDGTQKSGSVLLNPGMEIPWEATHVHGITRADIAKKKDFSSIVPLLRTLFAECVISGYNSRSYDMPVIKQNAQRYGKKLSLPDRQIDVRDIYVAYSKSQRGTLIDVAAKYKIYPETAHRALSDVVTTAKLLEAMLKQHSESYVLNRLVGAKGVKRVVAPVERVVPEGPTRPEIRRAIMVHVENFGSIDAAGYLLIQQQLAVSEDRIKATVAQLFSSKTLTNAQVSDLGMQALIAAHIDEALALVPHATKPEQIKAALDKVGGLDVDAVQLQVALFNWVTDPCRQEDAPGMGL